MLSTIEIYLLILIALTFLAILSNRYPAEIIALVVLLILGFSGIVTPEQALSGFSSSVVITLIGLFVIIKALEETGAIFWVAERLHNIGQGSEVRLIGLFMLTGAMLSLIMNNVAAGAVLLPAVVRVGQISKVRVSRLLIPLSFGTLIGGMATYLTTANIVMSELLQNRGLTGLGMRDFIPAGSVIVVAGIAYMLLIGRRLLPERESITQTTIQKDLQETYQLDERMWEVKVLPDSRIVDVPLWKSRIGAELGITILAVWHGKEAIFMPDPDHLLHAGDYLLILGRKERIDRLLEWGTELRDNPEQAHPRRHKFHVDLIEAIIPPRSAAIGHTLKALEFRKKFGLTAVALWREGRSYRTDVGAMPLQVGDALLAVGDMDTAQKLIRSPDYLVPLGGYASFPLRRRRMVMTFLITAIVLAIGILGTLPLPEVMLAGAVAMVLTRSIRISDFYDAIEWRVIFLIAGMLPLSIAIAESGLADRLGALLVGWMAGSNPLLFIAGVFLLSMSVTQIIGGQVTALLVGPIAINAALQLGVNPQAVGVTVAIACSSAFLTPIAHPVNVLMMGPGGYRFSDFFKVGLGMTLVTLIALLVGMTLFWQLG